MTKPAPKMTFARAAKLVQEKHVTVRFYPDQSFEILPTIDTGESAGEPSSLREWRERRENAQGRTSYKGGAK